MIEILFSEEGAMEFEYLFSVVAYSNLINIEKDMCIWEIQYT